MIPSSAREDVLARADACEFDVSRDMKTWCEKREASTTETQPAVAFAFAKAMADSGHGESAVGCGRGVESDDVRSREKLSGVRFKFFVTSVTAARRVREIILRRESLRR